MDSIQKVVDFCIRHQTILGYSIVSLLTAGSEKIFSSVVFNCPCNSNNMLYGSSFLLAPAFILLLLGLMVNPRRWCLLKDKCSPEKHCKFSPCRTCGCVWQLWLLIARAFVAPLTWIAVALLGANYYECAASGSSLIEMFYCKGNGTECRNLLLKMPCDKELSAKISSEWLSLHAQSQLLGWLLIASIMTVGMISACVSHCCSSTSYLELEFCEIYSKKEQDLFQIKAKEHVTKLAERNINCFFEATDPAPIHIPSNEHWKKISISHIFNPKKQNYSMLHEYMNDRKDKSTKVKEEGQELTVLACG